MEEDIENYSPTVMFRGTPCNWTEWLHGRPNYRNPETRGFLYIVLCIEHVLESTNTLIFWENSFTFLASLNNCIIVYLGHDSRLQLENRLLAPTQRSGRVPPHWRSSVCTPPPQVLHTYIKIYKTEWLSSSFFLKIRNTTNFNVITIFTHITMQKCGVDTTVLETKPYKLRQYIFINTKKKGGRRPLLQF